MAARSGLLHQHGDNQLRILRRGKPGKPRVGFFSGLKFRRPGFSGYGIGIGADPGTGSIRHNTPHEHRKRGSLLESHQVSVSGRQEFLYFLTRCGFHVVNQIWFHQRAAISNGRCDHGIVQRRHLGVALTNVQKEYGVLSSVVNGLATAVGFTIAITIMAGIREKIEYNDIPKPFQGTAIVLITACLMSIAFMGFSGMI